MQKTILHRCSIKTSNMKRTFLILILISFFASSMQCSGQNGCRLEQSDSIIFNRPQTPKPPFPYVVKDVSYFNQDESIQFGATLTLPDEEHKHPVAILISGSGQNDRDCSVADHKLFWVIADHLTKNGIGVLRIDDRGIGATGGRETVKDATSYDFAMDIAAGIEFLKKQKSIDTLQIGLIGHSGGATIASILGAERNDIAFIVSMAGVSISFKDNYLSQTKFALQRLYPTHNNDSTILYASSIIDIIKEEKDNNIAEQKIHDLYLSEVFRCQDSLTHAILGLEIDSATSNISISNKYYGILLTPWYRHFFELNSESIYKHITAPFLAINGDKDKLVLADPNLNGFKNIFDKCGKTNYRIIKYPELNHIFQHCKTGFNEEIPSIDETISNDVLTDITNWIKEQTNE